MSCLTLLLFTLYVFADKEIDLGSDAANPYGATEAVVNLSLSASITDFTKLYNSLPASDKNYPASVDHRSWVGPAKQQSATSAEIDVGCGSCTTFSVIASAEFAYYKQYKKVANFSEMELVDCMYKAGGCNGNVVSNAIKHVFNNGVTFRSDYPYTPTDLNTCNSKVTRYYKHKFVPYSINPKNTAQWKTFVNKYGGFSLAFYYGTFTKDKNDIVVDCKGASANPKAINHAVAVAGYGKTNGVEYFLIRNSWGTTASYHDKGYIKIKVGACNSQASNYYGFVFDTCGNNKAKNSCTANPTCKWSLGKCKSKYISYTTKIADSLVNGASFIDSVIDKFNGIGLNGLPSTHALRKSTLIGSEFMCFLKAANKNKDASTVDSWYKKALSYGYINKTTSKITNYAKLRAMLGIKKAITTTIATKKALNKKYQQMDLYRFHVLKELLKYWDARYNQKEKGDTYLILGTCKDGAVSMKNIDWSKM